MKSLWLLALLLLPYTGFAGPKDCLDVPAAIRKAVAAKFVGSQITDVAPAVLTFPNPAKDPNLKPNHKTGPEPKLIKDAYDTSQRHKFLLNLVEDLRGKSDIAEWVTQDTFRFRHFDAMPATQTTPELPPRDFLIQVVKCSKTELVGKVVKWSDPEWAPVVDSDRLITFTQPNSNRLRAKVSSAKQTLASKRFSCKNGKYALEEGIGTQFTFVTTEDLSWNDKPELTYAPVSDRVRMSTDKPGMLPRVGDKCDSSTAALSTAFESVEVTQDQPQ